LSSHGSAETHVANDDCRERIYNTVGDGPVQRQVSLSARYAILRDHLRCKDTDEDQNGLGIEETQFDLTLIERLVLDSSLVASNALDSDESLALVEEGCIGG
jgi:uncharacterized protein involved in copper resistance